MTEESTFRLLHYCVTNLDSAKIRESSAQLDSIRNVIKRYDFDILSLNGIQYDFVGVPNASFCTEGKNLGALLAKWGLTHLTEFFTPSNIGATAKPGPTGQYFRDAGEPGALSYVDDVNFGTMPGQLSTGVATKYMVVDKKVFTRLLWKDFNRDLDLRPFRSSTGNAYSEQVYLFDKSFSDVTLRVGHRYLHLILLHPTPSYHFGNPLSINELRNAEQLKFLEWYVSGATDRDVQLPGITPLTPDDYFIVVGDLNTDVNNTSCQGSVVLRRLLNKFTPWMKIDETSFTNEAPHFGPRPLRLTLDYMIASTNIEIVNGGVLYPDLARCELGCTAPPYDPPEGKNLVAYGLNEANLVGEARQTLRHEDGGRHYALVDSDYVLFKQASHHYPIFGEYRFK